jgi:hypothetical protein
MTTTSHGSNAPATLPATRPVWHDQAMDAADEFRRRAGLDELLVVAPFPAFRANSAFAGGAIRDDADDTQNPAEELEAALGRDRLSRMCVAYVDCFAKTKNAPGLAREIGSLVDRVGQVIAIEAEAEAESSLTTAPAGAGDLRALGVEAREHRVPARLWGDCGLRMTVVGPPRRDAVRDAAALGVAIVDHQGKSQPFSAAVVGSGHVLSDYADTADVILIDHDVPFHGRLPFVDACVEAGGRAFLYPHGADAALMSQWDGMYPIYPRLSGALVAAEGHAEIARAYGYPLPVHIIGWSFCPLAPRRPGPVRNILFAPTHPPYMGHPRYPQRNTEVFESLLNCPAALVVRHIGSLEENGLYEVPHVTFVRGDFGDAPGMIEQIDAAGCVVADRGTFGNMAIARGATTVLWDSAIVVDNEGVRSPDNIDRYRELIRFPFDVDDGGLWETITVASQDTDRVAEWRDRFIGDALHPQAMLDALLMR